MSGVGYEICLCVHSLANVVQAHSDSLVLALRFLPIYRDNGVPVRLPGILHNC